jgi:hypothetical protein
MTDLDTSMSSLAVHPDINQTSQTAIHVNLDEVSIELGGDIENKKQSPIEKREDNEVTTPIRCVLEDYTQCSRSHLWKLMMSFYDRKGPESWSHGIVPHFITSNAFIGRTYAKVLQGYIHDCIKKIGSINVDEPLYIVELGAGSGKFSFYMLRALEELQELSAFPFQKIIYVMTDFTEANFKFWCSHPSLKPYFDKGVLDAGIFDAVSDSNIKLWRSGKVLSANCCVNPICVVANYLFDTLCHDIFQVDGGELKEGLVSVGTSRESEPDPLEPDIINRLENTYRYNTITTDYYKDEEGDEVFLQLILDWYRDHFKNAASGASFLVPIGALRALRRLARFSSNGIIVISGDKGNNSPEQFAGISDPYIAIHGSFSLMVNYHAVGLWFTSKGGFALHNPQEEASLKVSCFVLPGQSIIPTDLPMVEAFRGDQVQVLDEERGAAYTFLGLSFRETCIMFGPNDFFVLQKSTKEECSSPSLRTVVSMLKLSDWDPDVFFKFRDVVLAQTPNCGPKLRNDLARGIPRLWANYFVLDSDKDIAFEIGRFYYGIRDYANALHYYEESINSVGEHHITLHNQGLCYYSLGKLETALSYFSRSLSINNAYEKARSWVDKVNKELEVRSRILD